MGGVRFLWRTSILGAAVLIAAQLVPYGHQRVNPPVVMEPMWDSAATSTLARQACFDCHSNETRWPSYARVAPVSWLIQHDVDEGRAVLNFSEWHRPQEEMKEAADAVLERDMPPAAYALMHEGARLSDADRDRLARGLANTFGPAQTRAMSSHEFAGADVP